MKPKTQKEAVLLYLKKYKSITPIQALKNFGCFRLSHIIYSLKKEGVKIKTDLKKFKSKFGFVGNYAQYKLITKNK